jgi:hypothetical protein
MSASIADRHYPATEPHRNVLQRFGHNLAELGGGIKDGSVDAGKGIGQLGYDVFWGSSPFVDEQT